LSRTAKLKWGLGHEVLKTTYKGAIVPILTYGAPVWEEAIQKQRNLKKYQSVQRLINIKIAEAYRTIPYEASCFMAGAKPIGLNPLKTEFFLNNIYKFSVYLTGNTLRLHYKAQPVNAIWGNSRCLLREPYGTHKYTVWAECRVLVC
jgi:hypothetical protein